jgi:(2R)-3-sulfolactate dehydrogenase (NADP+)
VSEPLRFSVEAIRDMALQALLSVGTRDESARSLAEGIAAAERDGIASHGLAYLPTYCEHVRCGKVDGQAIPEFDRAAPSLIVVDARSGFAHPAIALGFAKLIGLAREQGIAALAVRNSYNCGVLGYHTERLAGAGLLGIGFTNAPASIAPVGARKAIAGTNPWSVAAPDGEGGIAFLIDQSASVVAKSEVMKKARQGQPIPEHWALDAEGRPTTDAEAALKGTMAPSGGYKGVNSAIFVELMAACLAGATLGINASPFSGTSGGPPRTGQFFIAVNPTLASGGVFADRVTALSKQFEAQSGAHLPGAGRKKARALADAKGVAVDPAILAKIKGIIAGTG